MVNLNKLSFIALSCFLSASVLAGGNAALMDKARQKAFLLNEEVIKQLDLLDGNRSVSLSARIVRNADGSLQIAIDDIRPVTRSAASVESQTLPPVSKDAKNYIIYMPFEQMVKNHGPIKSVNSKPKIHGGGAAQ